MAQKFGYEGVLLFAIAKQTWPTPASPRSEVNTSIQSIAPDMVKGEGRMTTRANQGDEVFRAGRRTMSVDLEFVWDATDVLQILLGDVFYGDDDDVVGLKFPDATGGKGFEGVFGVFSYSRSEPDGNEPQMLTVTVKPRGNLARV